MLSTIEPKGSGTFQSTKQKQLFVFKQSYGQWKNDNALYSLQDKSDNLSQISEKRQTNVWDTNQGE